ncbi:GNAT family N-acetyltransferase [Mycolicibacterium sp.]|uniref:GNAT family N-acetyltransferase n=1 Tax=Mycolicibacterium sp. TaxID=2320850 RepID=UPI003D0FEAAF
MTTDRTGAATEVTAEHGRFRISVEGRQVGVMDFIDQDGVRIFPHTAVDPTYRGRGLATILVREGLEATRATGRKIVPQCWMVAEFVEKNPEFADLLNRP